MVNLLVGGVDPITERGAAVTDEPRGWSPRLYFLDYLGTLQSVNFGVHGHTANFLLAVMDRYWEPDMEEDAAKELMARCIAEIRTRFLVSQPKFVCKKLSGAGLEVVDDLPTIELPDVAGVEGAVGGGAAAPVPAA